MNWEEEKAKFEATALEFYQSGKYKDVYTAYQAHVGVKPGDYDKGGSQALWSAFLDVWGREEHKRLNALYPVDKFLKELEALCLKYNVSLSSGCGCCGAGGVFSNGNDKDTYEFSFAFPVLKEIP